MNCEGYNSEEYVLRTNTRIEAFKSLEKFEDTLHLVKDDVYQWKWAIIILHNCLQCFMVLILEGTNQAEVIKDNTKDKRHIVAHLSPNENWNPENTRLDDFGNLYAKLKSFDKDNFLNDECDQAVEILTLERNNFIHYFPKGLSLFTHPVPRIMFIIMDIICFILFNLGRVDYKFEEADIKIMRDRTTRIKVMLREFDIRLQEKIYQMGVVADAI